MNAAQIAAQNYLEIHSWRKGHAICRDVERRNWAVIFPNGDVETDMHSLAVAKAWVDAGCFCPGDCTCRNRYRPTLCGCTGTHDYELVNA